MHRTFGLAPISVLQGQSLTFRYSTHHDVWAHPTLESLAACDYTDAVLLAGRGDGGGCENDADLACIDASDGFVLTPTQDELYLSCSVHDHCRNGQRLVVHVLPLPLHDGAPPPPAATSTYEAILAKLSDPASFAEIFGAAFLAALLVLVLLGLARCATHKTASRFVRFGGGRAQTNDPVMSRHNGAI